MRRRKRERASTLDKRKKKRKSQGNECSVQHNAVVVMRIKSRFPFHKPHKFQSTEGVGEKGSSGDYLQATDGGRRGWTKRGGVVVAVAAAGVVVVGEAHGQAGLESEGGAGEKRSGSNEAQGRGARETSRLAEQRAEAGPHAGVGKLPPRRPALPPGAASLCRAGCRWPLGCGRLDNVASQSVFPLPFRRSFCNWSAKSTGIINFWECPVWEISPITRDTNNSILTCESVNCCNKLSPS